MHCSKWGDDVIVSKEKKEKEIAEEKQIANFKKL